MGPLLGCAFKSPFPPHPSPGKVRTDPLTHILTDNTTMRELTLLQFPPVLAVKAICRIARHDQQRSAAFQHMDFTG